MSFPLEEDPQTALIAWTTTPWTLPSNLALCVNPALTYVKVKGQYSTQLLTKHKLDRENLVIYMLFTHSSQQV